MSRGWRAQEGQYEVFDDIMEGDVVRWNDALRKVRKVTRYPDDRVKSVTFAILRRSWTNRPLTVVLRAELRRCFRGIAAKGVPLCSTSALECKVQEMIERGDLVCLVTARETVGVVF